MNLNFSNFIKALQLVSEKGALSAMLGGKNFSFASYKMARALKKHISDIETIIDAGANQGQFALMMSKFYPNSKIYSFEPVPEAYNLLKANTSSFRQQISIFNTALGNDEGSIKFYKNSYSHVSSALPISDANDHPNYSQLKTEEISVPLSKLDTAIQSISVKRPMLLKLDVQGFEKEVLKGAKSVLNQIDYIIIEMPFFHLYANQPLFNELNQLLYANGYEVYIPLDVNRGSDNEIIEIDFLYKRTQA